MDRWHHLHDVNKALTTLTSGGAEDDIRVIGVSDKPETQALTRDSC